MTLIGKIPLENPENSTINVHESIGTLQCNFCNSIIPKDEFGIMYSFSTAAFCLACSSNVPRIDDVYSMCKKHKRLKRLKEIKDEMDDMPSMSSST